MRQTHHDSCAIASIRLATAGATMIHVFQNRIGIQHDLMTWLALDMSDEAYTATILL